MSDYNNDFQKLLISYMVTNKTAFTRSRSIINPEFFESNLVKVVQFIMDHYDNYSNLPTFMIIEASTNVKLEPFDDAELYIDWYLEHIEKFCRYRACELAVFKGVDLIKNEQASDLVKLLQDATQLSLLKDLGTSFFNDPLSSLKRIKDKSNIVSTGFKTIDNKLYGGFSKGSLNIFAGYSGGGKSLWLQNLALNWTQLKYNVIYITLELSEDLVSLRMTSMLTGKETKEALKNEKDTALQIALKGKNCGSLTIKKLPEAGTTCNDIKGYLKEYEVQNGFKPDFLLIDYLDLVYPNNPKINVSDMFTKDKYVSEEMRSIATEWDIPVVSASQLNRSAVEAQEFDHSHIAGGISKINTADNVIGIYTTPSMRERGEYQLQFMKTRSASCVGEKISLGYDKTCMRIFDHPTLDDIHTLEDENVPTKPITQLNIKTKTVDMEEGTKRGMSISQIAHPQNLSRDDIAKKRADEDDDEITSKSEPLRARLSDLIAKAKSK